MRLNRAIWLPLICVFAAPLWGHFGKTTTRFPVQHAPLAQLGDTVKLTVQVAVPNASGEAAFLTSKMTAALKAGGVSISPAAPLEVIVTLEKLEAAVNEKRVSQVMVQHTGDRRVLGVALPICKPGPVEVEQ